MMMQFKFPKKERLKSRKDIELLFKEGEKAKMFPILLVYRFTNEPEIKAMFSVSTRQFKKAVDRNRIKRMMREIYRLNRTEWFKHENKGMHLCIIYLSKEKLEYGVIERKITEAVRRSNINYT